MRTKNKADEWKSVAVDASNFTATDFEFFGGIEELTDYEVIKPNKKRKRNDKETKITKKKKKKAEANGVSIASPEDDGENEVKGNDHKKEETDLTAWCNCFVPDEILKALRELHFEKPTQIQELVLPPAIRDHQDILAAAETGSGKTLAFGIPVITHIMAAKNRREDSEDEDSETKLKSLILTPTRELAIQVRDHLQVISKYLNIKIICIVGGMSEEKQRRLLQKCPEIIVATPGRLWQLMEENEPYLRQIPFIRYLVIDEADRMVERGHFEELLKILELINENKKCKRRQNFVFSATLTMVHDLPKRLELKKKKKIIHKNKLESLMSIVGIKDKPKIIDVTRKSGLVGTLTESQILCTLEEKDSYLYYFVVSHPGRTLIFCNSINCVRRLKSVFELLGCRPLTLHASMHQRQRLKNLETFAASEHGLLLATDVAARGLDIQGIEHVVHFQVPRTAEIYVHRSGRTARAQKEGLSLMLVEPQDAVFYRKICKTLNKDKTLSMFPVDNSVLKIVKERVTLARHIDQQQHRVERLEAQNRWFIKAAEEMDADIDDENFHNKKMHLMASTYGNEYNVLKCSSIFNKFPTIVSSNACSNHQDRRLNELGDEQERAKKYNGLKSLKKQLAMLLKKPIVRRAFTGSYPTKMGKCLEPTLYGCEKAVTLVKENRTAMSSAAKNKKRKWKQKPHM